MVVEVSLLMTWRFWKVAIAQDLRHASGRCAAVSACTGRETGCYSSKSSQR